jgi:hypothetical protein
MAWIPARGPCRGVAMLWRDEPDEAASPARLPDFLDACACPFVEAVDSVEETWEGAVTLEAAIRLVNESLVGIGVFISVVPAGAWDDQAEDLDATWNDGLATRFLMLAAIGALGARITAPPAMSDEEAMTYPFTLVESVLARHRPYPSPVDLHLFVLNSTGKLLKHHRLLEAASLGDAEAADELALLYPIETDATRLLTLLFMALSAAALGAVYLLDPPRVSFVRELAGRLPRPSGVLAAG